MLQLIYLCQPVCGHVAAGPQTVLPLARVSVADVDVDGGLPHDRGDGGRQQPRHLRQVSLQQRQHGGAVLRQTRLVPAVDSRAVNESSRILHGPYKARGLICTLRNSRRSVCRVRYCHQDLTAQPCRVVGR